jgi:hypothetical protein
MGFTAAEGHGQVKGRGCTVGHRVQRHSRPTQWTSFEWDSDQIPEERGWNKEQGTWMSWIHWVRFPEEKSTWLHLQGKESETIPGVALSHFRTECLQKEQSPSCWKTERASWRPSSYGRRRRVLHPIVFETDGHILHKRRSGWGIWSVCDTCENSE